MQCTNPINTDDDESDKYYFSTYQDTVFLCIGSAVNCTSRIFQLSMYKVCVSGQYMRSCFFKTGEHVYYIFQHGVIVKFKINPDKIIYSMS